MRIKKEGSMIKEIPIEQIPEKDLQKYFEETGSVTAIHEIVKRHNKEREKTKEGEMTK